METQIYKGETDCGKISGNLPTLTYTRTPASTTAQATSSNKFINTSCVPLSGGGSIST